MPTPTGLIRAKQTERLVAAFIPATTAPTVAVPDAAATVIPPPASAPLQPARFVHRTALLDDHGRLREATRFAVQLPHRLVQGAGVARCLEQLLTQSGWYLLVPRVEDRVLEAQKSIATVLGWSSTRAVATGSDTCVTDA